jgi:pimeloyl-ACP methyl ester carboxylesterase
MAELFPIAEARGPKTANVIFFHGLGGDAQGTWSADSKDKASFWPAWLAQDIEGLSVYSVGYEASVSGWNGSAMELTDRAANVLNLLLVNPDLGAGQLILVGHSLGGLVIKQVLRKAADEATDRAEALSFIERVRKVAFLATPHAGSDLAGWGDRLRVLIEPSAATRSLLRNDQHLRDLNLWYRRWARQRGIDHLILTETKTTSLFGMIVKPDSSDPGLSSDPVPIDTDHIDIAKPLNRESEVYLLVLNFIKRPTERPVSHEEIGIDSLKGPLEKPIDGLFGWTASFWSFLKAEENQKLLGWIGGGLVVLAAGLWAVFVHFYPAPEAKPSQKQIEAECGSVAIGGDVSGATITAGSGGDCPKPRQ